MSRGGVGGAVSLIKTTPGARTPGNQSGGTNPTEVTFAARGYVDDYDAEEIDGTIVVVGDRKVVMYGATIAGAAIPAPNDKATVAGTTYRIKRVTVDPANARFICQTHGPGIVA